MNNHNYNENFEDSIVYKETVYFHLSSAPEAKEGIQALHVTLSIDYHKSVGGMIPTESQMLGFSHSAQDHRCDVRHII